MSAALQSGADVQADALVHEIERKVDARRRELLDAAAREADDIRRRARVKVRRQMRRAIEEMRTIERRRTQQVRAEVETAQRQQASLHALECLALAWPRLAAAIERRWNDRVSRTRWMTAQVALAHARMSARSWVVRHPAAAWDAADTAALREMLRSHRVADATLVADSNLPVGLVVEADGVRLDGTPRALLADRPLVEAALLARLELQAAPGSAS